MRKWIVRGLGTPAVVAAMVLGAAAPARADFDVIGGDDVVVATFQALPAPSTGHLSLDATDAGVLYAAVTVDADPGPAQDPEIRIYWSQDQGLHWSLYNSIGSAVAGESFSDPALHVGEGTTTRLYVAYLHDTPTTRREVRVATTPLGAPSAAWVQTTALASSVVDFEPPSLHSSEATESAYTLFLVASGDEGNGEDVYFTRSTTFGASWVAGYRIASVTTSDRSAGYPTICYGRNGVVHVSWWLSIAYWITTEDDGVYYRRALNRAASALDWQAPVAIGSTSDGFDQGLPHVAASPVSDEVMYVHDETSPGPPYSRGRYRASTTAGTSWPASSTPFAVNMSAGLTVGDDGGFHVAANEIVFDILPPAIASGTAAGLSGPLPISDRRYGRDLSPGYGHTVATDPTHGHRPARIWIASGAAEDTLYFDATWLRDPGVPNLAPGFPMTLPATPVAAPAICELDGDAQREIVYGDFSGNVWALHHDGTTVSGWPRNVGAFPAAPSIAVGDVDADGHNDVVVGSSTGVVWAWSGDGTPKPGFHYLTGVNAPTYVSLGRFGPSQRLDIVVGAGTQLFVLRADGVRDPGVTTTLASAVAGPVAIGDVDEDGTADLVLTRDGAIEGRRVSGTLLFSRPTIGTTFSTPPALADLDLDGDLEAVAASDQGHVYAVHHTGADVSGWPVTVSGGNVLTAPLMANVRGTSEPEVFWGERGPSPPGIRGYYGTGAVMSGFPAVPTTGWNLYATPIVDRLSGSPEVFVASRDSKAWSWSNFGVVNPLWPKDLGAQVELSPASGDLDADGDLELVLLARSPARLIVLETNAPLVRGDAKGLWPMYGYNPERQFCLGCNVVDAMVDAPGGPVRARLALRALGNPAREPAFAIELPEAGAARLEILDVSGRRVATPLKEEVSAGSRVVRWDGRGVEGGRVAAGVYFARLKLAGAARGDEVVRRITLLP